jgi:hypothetical protein
MTIFNRICQTARVIGLSIFPPRRQTRGTGDVATESAAVPAGPVRLSANALPICLADFNSVVDRQGRLALFFPDCMAAAAPFLLFRLKRTGFSGCRAVVTDEGLLLTAIR